ncbi:hypothetical protein CLOBL_11890 [Clostridium sp. BL-8]|nr:hypothetical protein CLOBL_11890 [Clostridium sp. BL-8]
MVMKRILLNEKFDFRKNKKDELVNTMKDTLINIRSRIKSLEVLS